MHLPLWLYGRQQEFSPFPYASYVSATLATFLYVSSYLLKSQIGRLTKSVSAVLHLFLYFHRRLCVIHIMYTSFFFLSGRLPSAETSREYSTYTKQNF
jgi:hypothetical protein